MRLDHSRRGKRATWRQRSRPWRVFVLAVLAVAGTTAASGAAANLFWEATGHRYADDILRQEVSHIDIEEFLGDG